MPVTVAEVVRRLGGDPADIEQVAGWDYDDTDALHLRQVGPAVVMAQTGGWEGVRDEALRWLSDGASVHSSWCSPTNGRSFVCYAAFGRVLTRLEHLDDDQPAGEQPTALDEDRASLRDDLDDASQLAFVEQRTGIRLDPDWSGGRPSARSCGSGYGLGAGRDKSSPLDGAGRQAADGRPLGEDRETQRRRLPFRVRR